MADLYRVGWGLNWYLDQQILAETGPVVARVLEATTRGDLAAVASHLSPDGVAALASRVAADPARYVVRAVDDFHGVQIYHHHPVVIGARVRLQDGRVLRGRFRLHWGPSGQVVLDAFELGETPGPAAPGRFLTGRSYAPGMVLRASR